MSQVVTARSKHRAEVVGVPTGVSVGERESEPVKVFVLLPRELQQRPLLMQWKPSAE